jgi:hypothetical protein
MRKFLAVFLALNFAMLTNGCSSGPPKPVLPDGLHRVPVNSAPVNRMPPVPASSVSPALPDAPADGGGR